MVEKILTLSSAHVTKETKDWLDKQAKLTHDGQMDFSVFPKEDDGWFIPLNERIVTEELEEKRKIPVEFFDVINYAIRHQCKWLLIDHEGDIIEELNQY
ncbi:hypothetical protein [Bacillus sp. 1P06AnD]|uniref:DUF5983 family protein n=1 Tax=Bacillus sp. 1P06AnD TaxID=3132208 RepID=UPI00399F8AAA